MENLQLSEKLPHPLEQLTVSECNRARDLIRRTHKESVIDFRTISLEEPPKAHLQRFLEFEHSGNLRPNTPRPDRLARVSYDVIGSDRTPIFHESVIDVRNGIEIGNEIIDAKHQAPLTLYVSAVSLTQRMAANIYKWRIRPPSESCLGFATL